MIGYVGLCGTIRHSLDSLLSGTWWFEDLGRKRQWCIRSRVSLHHKKLTYKTFDEEEFSLTIF